MYVRICLVFTKKSLYLKFICEKEKNLIYGHASSWFTIVSIEEKMKCVYVDYLKVSLLDFHYSPVLFVYAIDDPKKQTTCSYWS